MKIFIISLLTIQCILGPLSTTPMEVSAQSELRLFVFIAEDCPISIYMADALREVSESFGKDVDMQLVFPMNNSTLASAQEFIDDYELQAYGIQMDTDQALARQLGATITPEAVVVDGSGTVVYRGRINNTYFAPGKKQHRSLKKDLAESIAGLIAGNPATASWPRAIGCFITFAKMPAR